MIKSFSKINLSLRVLKKLETGLHDIQSNIMLLNLYDVIKINKINRKNDYKQFHQKLFDTAFNQIEMNMRELGYGDVTVNKNMKFLVKSFYNILFFCEKFNEKRKEYKRSFLNECLECNIDKKTPNYDNLIDYFNDFQTFCFDLSSDSVLKGEFKFKFN